MKLAFAKKLHLWLVTLVLIGGIAAVPSTVDAATKAYFKAFGADVMAGGWFINSSSCGTSVGSNYQDPSYSTPGYTADDRTGGILAYAKESGGGNPTGGASSQYAAFASGSIEGSDANSYGFYSAGARAGTVTRTYLTFSNFNSTSSFWGGKFDGGVRQSHCIPDYYSKRPNPPPPGIGTLSSSTPSGIYAASAGAGSNYSLTSADVNIAPGTEITIYVNGNVYIPNNIRMTLDKENNAPKFSLVARGNIYVDAAVSQLDGLYIAQPATNDAQTPSRDDGNIWTCHPNDTNQLLYTYAGNCTGKLVINGALIAKQVNFMRTNGDVVGANNSEDSLSNALSSGNIAETVNFTPAMVIGGPFFNVPPPSGLPVDSIISLPPVF